MRVGEYRTATTIELARSARGTKLCSVIPIHIFASPGSGLTLDQAINFMDIVGQRIINAPFARFIRPEIEVKAVFCDSNELQDNRLMQLPWVVPSLPVTPEAVDIKRSFVAHYDPFRQGLFFHGRELVAENETMVKEVATHELLHALSPIHPQQAEDNVWVAGSGIARIKMTTDGSVLCRENVALNEGFVELFREISSLQAPFHINEYHNVLKAMRFVAGRMGLDAIGFAHFNNDVDFFAEWLAPKNGRAVLRTLDFLAQSNINASNKASPHERASLLGVAENGLEHYAMKYWLYTAEDRARMPKQIDPSLIPGELGRQAQQNRVRIFTNLTEQEFLWFQNQLREPHDSKSGARELFCELERREAALFIRKGQVYGKNEKVGAQYGALVEALGPDSEGVPLIPGESEPLSLVPRRLGEIFINNKR